MGQSGSRVDLQHGPDFAQRRIVLPYDVVENSINRHVKRTEASSLIPAYRLGRSGVDPVPLKYYVYGDPRHHVAFLNPEVLEHFVPYVCDRTLPKLLEVCTHWFVTIHSFMVRTWCEPITEGFRNAYQGVLQFEKRDISVQPLYTEDFAIRVDLLLYAKVLPSCKGKCLEIANSYAILQPSPDPSFEAPQPPENHRKAGERQRSAFRIEVKPRGASRDLWLRKDSTRFHGDEILVVGGPNVPEICVYDRIEVPVNLSHALGLLDPTSVRWAPPVFVTSKHKPPREYGQKCLLDGEASAWYDFDSFVSQTPDPISTFDFFKPQWQLKSSEYSGTSIVVSRSRYSVERLGKVEKAPQVLGLHIRVLDRDTPIVVPLKRLGMEHDRFANHQMRKGDKVTLYVVQGGPEPP